MAHIFATRAYNMDDFNLWRVAIGSHLDARLGEPFTVNGKAYPDRVTATWIDGTGSMIFGSGGFSLAPDGQTVRGDITGVFLSGSDGPGDIYAGLQGLSFSVAELDSAIATFGTLDDFALLEQELAGHDTFTLSSGNDLARGYAGEDTMDGGGGSDALYGGKGSDVLSGNSGADRLHGEAGDDRMHGGIASDVLVGDQGRDRLDGGAGADRLYGGLQDNDRDVFVLNRHEDSTTRRNDTVFDFGAEDKIDLHGIDAWSSTRRGNEAFHWSGDVAEAHSVWRVMDADGLYVRGDVDGDARADFEIFLDGIAMLRGSDLIL